MHGNMSKIVPLNLKIGTDDGEGMQKLNINGTIENDIPCW